MLDAPDPATRDGVRDRAMLHLAVCAGLRVSELTGLKFDDIDLSSMSIRVSARADGNGRFPCGRLPPQPCGLGSQFAAGSQRPRCSSTLGESR